MTNPTGSSICSQKKGNRTPSSAPPNTKSQELYPSPRLPVDWFYDPPELSLQGRGLRRLPLGDEGIQFGLQIGCGEQAWHRWCSWIWCGVRYWYVAA